MRSKLDELKRQEMDRLRKLTRQEHELEMKREHGNDDKDLSAERRAWRTLKKKQQLEKGLPHLDAGTFSWSPSSIRFSHDAFFRSFSFYLFPNVQMNVPTIEQATSMVRIRTPSRWRTCTS